MSHFETDLDGAIQRGFISEKTSKKINGKDQKLLEILLNEIQKLHKRIEQLEAELEKK